MSDYSREIAQVRQAFPRLVELQQREGGEWIGTLAGCLAFYLTLSPRLIRICIPALRIESYTGRATLPEALTETIADIQEQVADRIDELSLCLPPKPKSDMVITAYLMEGDRRKAQGLPSDRDAQDRAAADAMAWAEDKPG